MELKNLCTTEAHEKGAKLTVLDPVSGDPTDVKIFLVGGDSPTFRAIVQERNQLRAKDQHAETPDVIDARDIEMLVKATRGWEGITVDGKELPFTLEKCRELYKFSPSIRGQVDRFIVTRSNFPNG